MRALFLVGGTAQAQAQAQAMLLQLDLQELLPHPLVWSKQLQATVQTEGTYQAVSSLAF